MDALIDGCVAEGIPRKDAIQMSAQCFRGYSTLIARGDEPAELKNSLLIPHGITVNAMLQLERGGIRSVVADTIAKTIKHTYSMSSKGN